MIPVAVTAQILATILAFSIGDTWLGAIVT
jgi:hypothetical protein